MDRSGYNKNKPMGPDTMGGGGGLIDTRATEKRKKEQIPARRRQKETLSRIHMSNTCPQAA